MMCGRVGIIWVSWIVWIFSATILWAQEIPQREITELREALKEAGESRSSTRKRLAYKRVIRDGECLVKDHVEATAVRERAKAANLRQITEYYRSVHQRLERLYVKGKIEDK